MHSSKDARKHFSTLLDESQHSDILIIEHGKPTAVLLSKNRYEQLLELVDQLEEHLLNLQAQVRWQAIQDGEATLSFTEVFNEDQ
ncbi:MAG: type II toxin-antitoxin system Phd/YefM family antitoxin [Deinococcales bacterium]